jgi:hypothetical protein
MNKPSLVRILLWSIVATQLAACGGGFDAPGQGANNSAASSSAPSSNLVLLNQGQVSHSVINGSHYIQMSAVLNAGNMQVASAELPIIDPRSSANVGSISVGASENGQSPISVNLNLSQVASTPGQTPSTATLPNGTSLPVSNIDPSTLLTMPAGSSGSQVFLSFAQNILGFALMIPELTSGAGAINLLLPMLLGNNTGLGSAGGLLSGLGGLFSGSSSSQSGLTLFSDIGSILSSIFGGPSITPAPAPSQSVAGGSSSSGSSSTTGSGSSLGSDIGGLLGGLFGGSNGSSIGSLVGGLIGGITNIFGSSSAKPSASSSVASTSVASPTKTTVSTALNAVAQTVVSDGVQFLAQQPNNEGLALIEGLLYNMNRAQSPLTIR